MKAGFKLFIQKIVDHTLACNAGQTFKRIAYRFHLVMGFAGTIVTGVPVMLAAFIDHGQA